MVTYDPSNKSPNVCLSVKKRVRRASDSDEAMEKGLPPRTVALILRLFL